MKVPALGLMHGLRRAGLRISGFGALGLGFGVPDFGALGAWP